MIIWLLFRDQARIEIVCYLIVVVIVYLVFVVIVLIVLGILVVLIVVDVVLLRGCLSFFNHLAPSNRIVSVHFQHFATVSEDQCVSMDQCVSEDQWFADGEIFNRWNLLNFCLNLKFFNLAVVTLWNCTEYRCCCFLLLLLL